MSAVANKKYPPFLDIWKNRQRSGMKLDKKKNCYGKAITKSKKKVINYI